MTKHHLSFGQLLRERRITKGLSLRKFAKLVKISPTYLSQVEQYGKDWLEHLVLLILFWQQAKPSVTSQRSFTLGWLHITLKEI